MKKRVRGSVLGAALGMMPILFAGVADAATLSLNEQEAKQAAGLITAVVVSGRGVVAKHQTLINDAEKGDKGFTPDYVETQIREGFKQATGVDIDAVEPPAVRAAVLAALDASREAVKNNQGRINAPGVGFKGFIPAVYGRITGNVLKGKTGIDLKQTTFKYRNSYNQPDEFESTILTRFEQTKPQEGYGERVGNDYRYLRPVYIQQACLACHGDPQGELDISGKPKEGYKLGDLRGAISVKIPITR